MSARLAEGVRITRRYGVSHVLPPVLNTSSGLATPASVITAQVNALKVEPGS